MSRVTVSGDHLLGRGLPTALPGVVIRPVVDELPGWLQPIPGLSRLADRLGMPELRRRLLHMLPGLAPCLLWIIPHQDPWGPALIGASIITSLAIAVFAMFQAQAFARPGEEQWGAAVIGYVLPVLGTMLLLPGRSELGLMTLGIMAMGDGSAALGGLAWGGRRLPWNRRKTWTGLCCFVIAATSVGSVHYWMEARPGVPFQIALTIAGVAALVGAIVESLPLKSHDNLRVGTTAALTGLMMHVALMGW
jgi:dolichol kinase